MANKTYELRKALITMMSQVNPKIYEATPSTKPYPYLRYELAEMYHEDGLTVMELEVNVIDYGKSSRVVEDQADELQYLLHRAYYINGVIQFRVYKNDRQKVEEEDKEIIRRRLTFEIRLHELKGES